ncbi:L-lactate permease [Escherichia coli]
MFPFFSLFLGWLGGIPYRLGHFFKRPVWFTAVSTTAQQINVSDTLLVAANTSGGVTGEMLS